MASVSISGLRKSFGETPIIPSLDLEIEDGSFVVFLGPSGCGKSTLLRMIAGLESISSGDIRIGGQRVNDLEPKDRNIAMVFQNYALYAHMTVFDNIAFAMKLKKLPADAIRQKVDWAAAILNLGPYLDRYPRQLSGGQRQRVSMGRAIVRDPSVFLFDEPLSNLDAKLRIRMRNEIKDLHQRLGTTMIYVTHDQIEAMTMADRICVLREGRIEQIGHPLEIYDRPANLFVAEFIGSPSMNILRGEIVADAGGLAVRVGDCRLTLPPGLDVQPGTRVAYGVRPEHLKIAPSGGDMVAVVSLLEPTGPELHIYAALAGQEICITTNERLSLAVGDALSLTAMLDHVLLFDAESGAAIGRSSHRPVAMTAAG